MSRGGLAGSAERAVTVPSIHRGNDITAEPVAGGWKLDFSVGFGDCISGCGYRHYWTFSVSPAGQVHYLGARGEPLPPPDRLD